jgi:hypothetical protein
MKFVDYAPSASPSLEQQRDALRKGLGRAVHWALAGRLDDEPLLEACLQDQRFDHQVEGMRGDWLWEMVQAAGAANRFRVPILHALYELSDERSADQLCDLARRYVATGDEAFRSRLYDIVERNPFPNDCACLGEEEILALDGEPAFLFAARVRGTNLAGREWEWEDGSLTDFAVKRFGEGRVRELLDASTDATIRRFRDGWRQDKLRKARPPQPDAHRQKMAAISVAEIIRATEGDTKCYWFRGWGMYAKETDLRIILQRLWIEQEPQVIVKLLRIFSNRPLPDFDARLIELCRHGDEEVRCWAFSALERNIHPLIREFALAELHRGTQERFVASLFINNYRRGDEQILETMELPADACQLHWLLMDVNKIFEKNLEADCSRLGLIGYALTPCENCRCDSARLLLKQQAAPQWLIEECRHDSSEECRELFAKATGSTE